MAEVHQSLQQLGMRACPVCGSAEHPRSFAVHDGTKRVEKCAYLFEGTSIDWPPTPRLPETAK